MTEWIKETFDQKNQLYEQVFVPSREETEQQAQFVIEFANLTTNDRVFDLCCGTGRHVIALALKGIHIDGLDISPFSISEAIKSLDSLPQQPRKPELYIDDARELPKKHPELAGRYTLAINIFSSFGYYENEKDQLALLRGVFHILEPEGSFLLDLPNKDFILQNFSKLSEYTVNELAVSVSRKYDNNHSRIESRTTVSNGQVKDVMAVAMNLYSYTDIEQLLLQAGFLIMKVARDFTGEAFDPKDPTCKRMLILAKKI